MWNKCATYDSFKCEFILVQIFQDFFFGVRKFPTPIHSTYCRRFKPFCWRMYIYSLPLYISGTKSIFLWEYLQCTLFNFFFFTCCEYFWTFCVKIFHITFHIYSGYFLTLFWENNRHPFIFLLQQMLDLFSVKICTTFFISETRTFSVKFISNGLYFWGHLRIHMGTFFPILAITLSLIQYLDWNLCIC